MAAALVLQTQENCPPGLIGDWARSRGIVLDAIRVDRWGELPDPAGYDFAVALGSDASLAGVREDWVEAELEWLRAADAVGLPVLGICFGAQALAVALGGAVTRLATPESAWIAVDSVDATRVPTGPWLGLHEDAITPPPLARELARNDFGTQAFSFGRHLGVQFHPEATPALIAQWLRDKRDAAHPMPATVVTRAGELAAAAAGAAVVLFDGFTAQAGIPGRDAVVGGVKP